MFTFVMPNPYQVVPRAWPLATKKKAFKLYMQHYSIPEIEAATGVPKSTVGRWRNENDWYIIRERVVVDYEQEARNLLHSAVVTLVGAIKVADKIIRKLDAELTENLEKKSQSNLVTEQQSNCDYPEAKATLNCVTEQQSDNVPQQQSNLSPKDLSDFASALKDASDVLLRVFNK